MKKSTTLYLGSIAFVVVAGAVGFTLDRTLSRPSPSGKAPTAATETATNATNQVAGNPATGRTNSTSTSSVALKPNKTSESNAGSLKDAAWVQNPVNYKITAKPVPNFDVSVPILEYHEAKYAPGDIITLKPGELESQIQWLHQHGFHTINFGQLYAAMYYGYKLPSRPIILSFDDGYESAYLQVYPLLKKYGYQATDFVISSFVHQAPNRKEEFPKLSIPELKTLQASGVIDIESHTVHHLDLATLPDNKANQELAQSAERLSQIVHHPIQFFCYPDGGYKPADIALVRKNGYLLATTQHTGYANLSQGPLTLDRIGIYSYDTIQTYAKKLAPSLASHQVAPTVKSGDSGASVEQLQYELQRLGYRCTVDGSFGPGTETALKQFQRQHHLKADGVAGVKTLTALFEASGDW